MDNRKHQPLVDPLSRLDGLTNCWDAKDKRERTPLHCAVLHGDREAIKALLFTFEFQRDQAQLTAFDYAVMGGQVETMRMFVEDFNMPSYTQDLKTRTLQCAAFSGKLEALEYLQDELSFDLKATDRRSGRTALHWAVEGDQEDMVLALLKMNHVGPSLLEKVEV